MRTRTSETPKKIGETVILKGWIDSRRDHGKLIFIDLRDRSGKVQCVGSPREAGQNLSKITAESVVEIQGEIVARPEKLINPNLKTGKIEIHGFFSSLYDSKSGSGNVAILKFTTKKDSGSGAITFTCTGSV